MFWKLEELLVKAISVRLALVRFLEQLGSSTIIFVFISKRNCEEKSQSNINFPLNLLHIPIPFLTERNTHSLGLVGDMTQKAASYFFRLNSIKIPSVWGIDLEYTAGLLGTSSWI